MCGGLYWEDVLNAFWPLLNKSENSQFLNNSTHSTIPAFLRVFALYSESEHFRSLTYSLATFSHRAFTFFRCPTPVCSGLGRIGHWLGLSKRGVCRIIWGSCRLCFGVSLRWLIEGFWLFGCKIGGFWQFSSVGGFRCVLVRMMSIIRE